MASKGKALVIDDMERNRQSLKTFLSIIGFEVDTAGDGIEALEKLKTSSYSIIFSDVEMPNMNGLQFITKARCVPAAKKTPIVMLTTLDDFDTINKAKALGANYYLVKPFTNEKIKNALQALNL